MKKEHDKEEKQKDRGTQKTTDKEGGKEKHWEINKQAVLISVNEEMRRVSWKREER